MPEDLSQNGEQQLPPEEGQQPQGPEGGMSEDASQSFELPADGVDQPAIGSEEQPSAEPDVSIHLATVDHDEDPQGDTSASQPLQVDEENTDPVADKFRTKAEQNRDIDQLSEEELRLQEITHKLKTAHPRSMSTIGRVRLQLERDRLREAYAGPVYRRREERSEANMAAAAEFRRDFPLEADGPDQSSPAERARYYEEQASRIDVWARALHDHPLSDEFRAEYEGFQFQPRMMVRLEDSLKRGERELEQLEDESLTESAIGNDLHDAVNGRGSEAARRERDQINLMIAIAGAEEPRLDDQQVALRLEGEDLAERIDAFRRHVIEEVRIPEIQNQNAMTRKFLDDVRREVQLPVEDEPIDTDQQSAE